MGRDPAIFLEPVSDRLSCAICLDVLHEPTYVGCDQDHCFCKACLESHFALGNQGSSSFSLDAAYLRESSAILDDQTYTMEERLANFRGFMAGTAARCPLDRKIVNSSRMKAAVFVARMIGDLKVNCPFDGCDWIGLASDEHEFTCIHKGVLCTGCRKQFSEEEIEEHEEVCGEIIVSCEQGAERCGILRRKNAPEHAKTCAYYRCRFRLETGPCTHQGTIMNVWHHESLHFLFDTHQPVFDGIGTLPPAEHLEPEPEANAELSDDPESGSRPVSPVIDASEADFTFASLATRPFSFSGFIDPPPTVTNSAPRVGDPLRFLPTNTATPFYQNSTLTGAPTEAFRPSTSIASTFGSSSRFGRFNSAAPLPSSSSSFDFRGLFGARPISEAPQAPPATASVHNAGDFLATMTRSRDNPIVHPATVAQAELFGPSVSSGHMPSTDWEDMTARIDARVAASQRVRFGETEYAFPDRSGRTEEREEGLAESEEEEEYAGAGMPGGFSSGIRQTEVYRARMNFNTAHFNETSQGSVSDRLASELQITAEAESLAVNPSSQFRRFWEFTTRTADVRARSRSVSGSEFRFARYTTISDAPGSPRAILLPFQSRLNFRAEPTKRAFRRTLAYRIMHYDSEAAQRSLNRCLDAAVNSPHDPRLAGGGWIFWR